MSADGGTQPLWSPDGQELFYRNGNAMMSVRIETNPRFAQSSPEILFEGTYASPQGGRSYDISPNGDRFLMLKNFQDTADTARIIVVQNWFEELERLVPAE